MTASTVVSSPPAVRTGWVKGPLLDTLVAFAWVPVFVTGLLVGGERLADLTAAVLLVSFCHQPVTLPLIYGDAAERRRRAALLVLAPVLAVSAVYVGLIVSLALVGIVSGLWNAHHTLRQRYGLVRVYGRKVGQASGELEQALLISWFTVVLLVCVAGDDLLGRLRGLPVGFLNHQIVDLLDTARPLAVLGLVPATVWAAVVTVRWFRLERSRPQNRAKHLYLAGAAVAFVVAPIDPVAGFLGFMSAHSIEYLVVVSGTVRRRAQPGSVLGRVVSRPVGPVLFLVGYVVVVLALVSVARSTLPLRFFLSLYLGVGVLHFVFDGLIWKLRSPAVARTFAIAD